MAPTSDNGLQHVHAGEQASYGVQEAPGCVVITAEGEIDLDTAPGLRDAVKVATEFSHLIVIDLTKVTYIDSTGLGVLIEARISARAHDGTVALVGSAGNVRRALESAKLDEAFAMRDRVDEAIAMMSGLRLGDSPA